MQLHDHIERDLTPHLALVVPALSRDPKRSQPKRSIRDRDRSAIRRQEAEFGRRKSDVDALPITGDAGDFYETEQGATRMSKEEDNKAVVGRWFTEFWGKTVNLGVIDEIAAPDMLLKYSLHEPRRGRDDIRALRPISSRRVTMSLADGKAVAHTRGRLSRTS
jgi:hypothetical protein